MGIEIESIDFENVHEALEKHAITLENVEGRFVDFKTAYDEDDPRLEYNKRHGRYRAWNALPNEKKEDDFKKCCFLSEEQPIDDPIERWLAYRMKYGKPYDIDCDGSKTSSIIPAATNLLYGTLWPDTNADSADTMNSMWTTYKQALKLFDKKAWNSRESGKIMEEMTERAFDGAPPSLREEYVFHTGKGAVKWEEEVGEQLELLAYLTHTLGNFIPLESPLQNRWASTRDYWDITLMYIKDWYLHRQLCSLESELPSNGFNTGALGASRAWLDAFGEGQKGWNAFVRENHLTAYMKKRSCEDDTYDIRAFYEGHAPGALLPNKAEDLYKCLLNMNAAIIVRGNEMREELEETDRKFFFKE